MSVQIQYQGPVGVITDEITDISKIHTKQNTVLNNFHYNNHSTCSVFMREQVDGEAFVVYRSPSGGLLGFNVESNEKEPRAFCFSVSADGEEYSPVPQAEVTVESLGFWVPYEFKSYRVSGLSEDSLYLKIAFSLGSPATDITGISRVELTYRSDNTPPDAPKTLQFNIAGGETLNAPLPATDADGDELVYTVNDSLKPLGKVEIDHAAGIFIYTPKPGFTGHDIFKLKAADPHQAFAETRMIVTVTDTPSDTVYYVSGEGDDANDGLSETTAFRTVKKAHDLSVPGNTIYIMNGKYGKTGPQSVVTITRSGLPGYYITYKAYPGHEPVLNAAGAWNTILAESSSYIKIEGLKIEGGNKSITREEAMIPYELLLGGDRSGSPAVSATNTNGIAARPAHMIFMNSGNEDKAVFPHHIEVRGCEVFDIASGGISFLQCDHIIFENNFVHDNCRWDSHAGSGINIYGAFDVDTDTEDYKIIIRNNISINNYHLIPWYITQGISDGNGIIIDDNRHMQVLASPYPYEGKILITNNLVYGNGGSGIHSFSSDNVDIINNTSYMNNVSESLKWGEIFAQVSGNCNVYNNIAYFRPGNNAGMMADRNKNVVYDHNLFFNGNLPGDIGADNIIADPLFADQVSRNFELQARSPAIGAADPKWAAVVGNDTDKLGVFADIGLPDR
jgi:hypothetical protein